MIKKKEYNWILTWNIIGYSPKLLLNAFNYEQLEASLWNEASIGDEIYYTLKENKVIAELSIYINPTLSIGKIELIYEYTDNGFKICDIKYIQ